MSEIERKLRELKIEDYIWLIYYFIVTFAIISNNFERNYTINNQDIKSRKISNKINTTILIVAFFIYLYFVLRSFNNLEILKRNASNKRVRVAFENLIAQIIFLVGGAYSIYADFDANTTNVDIAIF